MVTPITPFVIIPQPRNGARINWLVLNAQHPHLIATLCVCCFSYALWVQRPPHQVFGKKAQPSLVNKSLTSRINPINPINPSICRASFGLSMTVVKNHQGLSRSRCPDETALMPLPWGNRSII